MKELNSLIGNIIWKSVCRKEVPPDDNILIVRFFHVIKYQGTNKEVWKGVFVVQGNQDTLKNSLVHNTLAARKQSAKLILRIAAIFQFKL